MGLSKKTGQVAQFSNWVLKLALHNFFLNLKGQVGSELAFKIHQIAIFMLFQPDVKKSVFLMYFCFVFFLKNKLYGPFLWMGFNCLKTRATWGGSLLFTTKFPVIPGTHFVDLGRMKVWVDLGATQWFWKRHPWIGNPAP